MIVHNPSPFATSTLLDVHYGATPSVSVIIKGTFRLDPSRKPAQPASDQLAILEADEPFDPEHPNGLLRFESDLVPFKPRSDVVLVGEAHAPAGRPVTSIPVRIQVGRLDRALTVFGDRAWSWADPRRAPEQVGPLPFTRMPLTYDRAFGGTDPFVDLRRTAPLSSPYYPPNPLGRGYVAGSTASSIHQKPLPNIEDERALVRTPEHRPAPTGCAFYPRACPPRVQFAGTYDEAWRKEGSPKPPRDFRFDYFNGAHPHFQIEGYLAGHEPVRLSHVHASGRPLEFFLPGWTPSLVVQNRRIAAPLDTVVFVPNQDLFYEVWRGRIPLARAEDMVALEVRIEFEQRPPPPWPWG